MRPILEVKIFYLQGMDFEGPFPTSNKKEYILVTVDDVSKLVKVTPSTTNSYREVLRFSMRCICFQHGCSRAIISDKGSHFNNAHFHALLKKYIVHHCVTTPYHPQEMGK